jgi:uncharacterized cupin superfamily protein
VDEAKIEETETGKVPADDGWYVMNLADVQWSTFEGGGTWSLLESPSAHWQKLGFGLHILWPGDSPGMYHAESEQEGFLVLSGECVAIVEGEERRMGPWDYLHSPAGTAHITIGAGDGPCVLAMVGTRSPDTRIDYIPEPAAARHGASVPEHTTSPKEAYRDRPPIRPAPCPIRLPTSS